MSANSAEYAWHPGWDALQAGAPAPGLAVAVRPNAVRVASARAAAAVLLPDEEASRPPAWTPAWRDALVGGVAHLVAARELPGAWVPALSVPRFVHGQSQGICDLFGARVAPQPDGNFFVHPLTPDPAAIAALTPRPLATSRYYGAVEWVRYARAATRGRYEFRHPVMTGPFDTANYLLGTTVLLEWVYTQPAAVHALLARVTDVIIGMLGVLRAAAGGTLHGDALGCLRHAFCLCSECRSIVSAATFEEFDAPYLARLGRELGPYAIHSCGSWERTIASARRDPQMRAMNGQLRENDLAELCRQAAGQLVLSLGPSQNLPPRYTWTDTRSFLRFLLATLPASQPAEVALNEDDLALWGELLAERQAAGRAAPGR